MPDTATPTITPQLADALERMRDDDEIIEAIADTLTHDDPAERLKRAGAIWGNVLDAQLAGV
ncbi:hypothetical protein ACFVAJ_16580 [Agromyces sp. NPDC057679]|uniref:hypothetical protein n=1 Tax=Agromyces sp. NPDC057679 TaxID=3346207 RepID=UPI00366FC4D0